jgi:hypothetical protein
VVALVVADGLVTGADDAAVVAGFAEVLDEAGDEACGDPHAVNQPANRMTTSILIFDIEALSPQ